MSPTISALMTRCESLSTKQLIEICRTLNLKTSTEEILVSSAAANVLETRLAPADFVAFMGELESELVTA